MKSRPKFQSGVLTVFLIALFLAPAASAGGPVWEGVTVHTEDGGALDNVAIEWILEGYNLRVTAADGSRTVLGPLRVTSIVDAGGRDITNEVAEACPADDVHFALLGDARTVPFTFKAMFEVGCSGALGVGDGSGSVVGAVYGGLRVAGGERVHFHLAYRRQHLAEAFGASDGEVTGASHELHLLAGYRLNHPRENNNYAYMEAGLALMDYDHRIDSHTGREIESTGMKIGPILQGGTILPLSPRAAVDLGAILMWRPSLITGGESYGMLFGLNLGLTFR